ncbi:DUF1380 domain-containing protein [Salmonella enterica]|nr:DUF1380 domain-containing protein [Salmonella enterica]EEH5466713.1 DUF1380 domain-containing protein [Salmonella enterica]EEH7556033.1 DUF1380 domain-containing protein [Salmonella enterica]EEO5640268.1 DUF1380 domain-containing protein [Salmonella enterica]EEQ0204202.1 DUF1380 domain-containing protein [Salmonella enterica]
MYGTVITVCCELLKAYENNEKIAAIIWCEEDVREVGAEFNPTITDTLAVLRAIGESDSDALWRDGIGQNFVEGELRRLAALRPPRQIAIPENELRILLPLINLGFCHYNDITGEADAALNTLRSLLAANTTDA